jgi:DNA repair exonuclease SbcCD ATPase subunit
VQDRIKEQQVKWECEVHLNERQQAEAQTSKADAANERIAELEAALQEAGDKTAQLQRLRDELDMAQEGAARASKAEALLAKCKRRMEEAGDLQAKLAKVEAGNADLLKRALTAEAESSKLESLRPQLQKYRGLLTDAQMESSELKSKLAQREAETGRLSASCAALQEKLSLSSEELHNLAQAQGDGDMMGEGDDNSLAAQLGSGLGGGGGVGLAGGAASSSLCAGFSEFNPKITAELEELRTTNASLRQKLDEARPENVAALEDDVEDLQRLKEMFEGKFHACTAELAAANQAIGVAKEEAATQARLHGDLREAIAAETGKVEVAQGEIEALEGTVSRAVERVGEMTAEVAQNTAADEDDDAEEDVSAGGEAGATVLEAKLSGLQRALVTSWAVEMRCRMDMETAMESAKIAAAEEASKQQREAAEELERTTATLTETASKQQSEAAEELERVTSTLTEKASKQQASAERAMATVGGNLEVSQRELTKVRASMKKHLAEGKAQISKLTTDLSNKVKADAALKKRAKAAGEELTEAQKQTAIWKRKYHSMQSMVGSRDASGGGLSLSGSGGHKQGDSANREQEYARLMKHYKEAQSALEQATREKTKLLEHIASLGGGSNDKKLQVRD